MSTQARPSESESPRLVLAPASVRGWFGGRGIEAGKPVEVLADVALDEAACMLQAEFESGDGLTAVLAHYDGTCTVVRFAEAREWAEDEPPTAAVGPAADRRAPMLLGAEWDLAPRTYRAAVADIRERIAAGDVYVMNLTARLEGELAVRGSGEVFETLRTRASADMAALFTGLPGLTPWIASVSPERFVRVHRDGSAPDAPWVVETCPIKGTRPRGATPAADEALARELVSNPKECAEHVMIVDLERNDLGGVCMPGSVTVEPLYEVVTTPYCHQLVSTVRGVMRADATFAELLQATFPCGSVTGAPKRAAMRIIAEIETTPRGAYCGALVIAMRGALDSSVLIRTLEGVDGTCGHQRARYGAGGGITHDSSAAAEHLEALLKASPVMGDSSPAVALRETIRVSHGCVPLLDLHLARLARGGAGPTVIAHVREAVAEQLAAATASGAYARLGVTVTPDGAVAAGLTLDSSSLAVEGGPAIAFVQVDEGPVLPRGAAKPASRRYWDRAHRAARLSGADQAILCTTDGTVIDGSTATVWLVREGALLTPPAPPAIAGVAREVVFDIAAQLGFPAREACLTVGDVDAADEVWLSNAVGGMVPARGRAGPLGERVAQSFGLLFGD